MRSLLQKRFVITSPSGGMKAHLYQRMEWKKTHPVHHLQHGNPTVATLPDLSIMESVCPYQRNRRAENPRRQNAYSFGCRPYQNALSGTVATIANVGEQRPNSNAKVFEILISVQQRDTTLRPRHDHL